MMLLGGILRTVIADAFSVSPRRYRKKYGLRSQSTGEAKTDVRKPAGVLDLISPVITIPRFLLVDHEVKDCLQSRIELVRHMRARGFEVHVAVPQGKGAEEILREGIFVHIFFLRRKSSWIVDELRCWFSLYRLYRHLQPTLVHHIGLKPTLYGGIAAWAAGVRAVVSTFTGLGYLFSIDTVKTHFLRTIVAAGLRFSCQQQNHHLIFQNPDDRDCLIARCNISEDRAALIKGSGVNLSLFTPKPEPPGPPVVLMASRLLWSKGVGEFIRAARALRARGVRARFVLVGEPDDGHPSAISVSMLKHWSESGDVEYLGWREDIPALLAQSHIMCLPSRYGEGIPRILVEAAASGRPIVATDCPGCREVVRHRQNGLLVPIGDSEALVRAIALLVENAPLRMAFGARGREMAVAKFSERRVIDASVAVYRSILASTHAIRKSF
jgi:glycosyltransferase involved in cell wall biosynthesis